MKFSTFIVCSPPLLLAIVLLTEVEICFSQNIKKGQLSPGNSVLTKWSRDPFEQTVFVEEHGQFDRTARERKIILPESIHYAVENGEFNAYFTSHGISFLFPESKNRATRGDQEEKTIETTWQAMNLRWLNTNASVKLSAGQKVADYYNYGGGQNDVSYNFVPAYKKIKYSANKNQIQ